MESKSMIRAQRYLELLPRIQDLNQRHEFQDDVLLLPEQIGLSLHHDNNVKTVGMGNKLDKKTKDLLRIIEIEDALNAIYHETNVLSPSVFVHEQLSIPYHITTQGFLISRLSEGIIRWIKEEQQIKLSDYGKHEMDQFWLPCSRSLDEIMPGETVCIFNRRIGGWDGTPDKPVIELLGAGGHLQSVWDDMSGKFISRTLTDNLRKEFDEEIGLKISDDEITCIGGFENSRTHELVLFSCISIQDTSIPAIQNYAFQNYNEDTDGIYIGTFEETMRYYKENPVNFAGGIHAAPTNFPNNIEIMKRIREHIMNI